MPASCGKTTHDLRDEQLGSAILLLADALRIIDEVGDRPDIGARLQGLIEALQED